MVNRRIIKTRDAMPVNFNGQDVLADVNSWSPGHASIACCQEVTLSRGGHLPHICAIKHQLLF